MKMSGISMVLSGIALLLVGGNAAGEAFFQETIDNFTTYRMTRWSDSADDRWWEETLGGNVEFGTMTNFIGFTHSVENIDPPVLPDGTILRARLKLYFRGYSSQELILTVDSLELDKINRRQYPLGPEPEDSVSVADSPLDDGRIYIAVENNDKQFVLFRSVFDMYYTPAIMTDVDEPVPVVPEGFQLGVNYPNPFNPSTTVQYSLPFRADVRIDVLNCLGGVVRTLVDKTELGGSHMISWDGKDNYGTAVAGGIYFCRFKAAGFVSAQKMILLK